MPIYAIFYGLAYLTGVLAFTWMARQRGIATAGVMMIMQAALVGGLVFANLAQWMFGGTPGKTVLGAIAGGYLCVWIVKARLGLRRPTGDLFAVALCAGEAVGRLGCYFGGCCYGKPADVAWAVWQHGAWRHPTQLYLSAACLLILVALWLYSRAQPPEDALFCLQGMLYCAARFGVEFYRVSPVVAAGLTAAQWACLAGFAFFAVKSRLLVTKRKPEKLVYAQA
jgi:phosphatidylglycerol:prolipoprotein diacylglycerol transferase